mmetsp:Transcript_68324/g.142385  ORF Transcript_68324/g.142385 Transcript_68324/m.142385 type:complete len:253 (-) Transcript_68324:1233-1991(-)
MVFSFTRSKTAWFSGVVKSSLAISSRMFFTSFGILSLYPLNVNRSPLHGDDPEVLEMSNTRPASSASYASSFVTSWMTSSIIRRHTAHRALRSHTKLVSCMWTAALGMPKLTSMQCQHWMVSESITFTMSLAGPTAAHRLESSGVYGLASGRCSPACKGVALSAHRPAISALMGSQQCFVPYQRSSFHSAVDGSFGCSASGAIRCTRRLEVEKLSSMMASRRSQSRGSKKRSGPHSASSLGYRVRLHASDSV